MTNMLSPSEAQRHDPFIQAVQQLAEAEQRRQHQIGVIAGLPENSDARAYAEAVLHQIDRTIAFSRTHQELIQNLLA